MKKLWCLVVVLSVFIAADAMAARVFLKDGSVVQCQSFWRSKDTVYVKVNRDVLLEFSPGEVNTKRTFSARPAKKVKPVAAPSEQATGADPGVSTDVAAPTQASAGGQNLSTPSTAIAPKAATTTPVANASGATSATSPAEKIPAADTPSTQVPAKPAAPPQPDSPPVVSAPAAVAEAAGMGLGLTFMLVPLLLAIIIIAAMWRVFEKAGEAGWKALIPIYNLYVLVAIVGKPWWWFLIILCVPLVGFIFYLLVCLALAQKFNKSPLYGVLLCFFGFIMFPLLAFDDSTYSG